MGAFDRIQNYTSRKSLNQTSEVFDVNTPSGAFLNRVHSFGFKMYDVVYKLKDEFCVAGVADDKKEISEEEFTGVVNKEQYEKSYKFTELHDAITTSGNQIINAVAGSGKALKNGSMVFGENGYKPIESLKLGDKLYGTDGKLHNVVGVYPQEHRKRTAYIFEMNDGTQIDCSEEHLWTVVDFETNESKTMTAHAVYEHLNEKKNGVLMLPNVSQLELKDNFNYGVGTSVEEHNATIKADVDMFIDTGVITDAVLYNKALRMAFIQELDTRYHIQDCLSDGCIIGTGISAEAFDKGLRERVLFLFKAEGYSVGVVSATGSVIFIIMPYTVIQGVSVYESVEDYTCIQVDSDNHLFLTEGLIPTHNTTALTFKILYDIVTGEAMTMKAIPNGTQVRVVNKMWVCTFLKTGAEELGKSLTSWQRRLGYSQTANQVVFSTMDAEFKRCLNAMGVSTPLGTAQKLHSLLCKAVDSCSVTRKGSALTKEDYRIIEGIIVYRRGRLDTKRYQHPSCSDYDLTPSIIDLIISQFNNLKQVEGIMDFEDIMELLYKYLYVTPNPAVQDFVSNRYNYIYIDEFQDTSQMAYAILKFYARGKLWMNRDGSIKPEGDVGLHTGVETLGKLVVVGDPSQSIYSFRGSDSKILTQMIDKDFRPCICRLSVNWRCPDNILNPVIPSIHRNEDSSSQEIKAANTGGELFAYAFKSYTGMMGQLKKDIKKDSDDDYSVGILCRTNFDGLIPAFVLEMDGKYDFGVSGENMTLNSPLSRKIIGVSSLFTERSSQSVKNTLMMFCRAGWQVNNLMSVLKQNNKSIWSIPKDDLNYSCPALVPFISAVRQVFMPEGIRDKSKEVEALLVAYTLLYKQFDGDSAYCLNARAYIETLMFLIENNNFETVQDFVDEVEYLNDKLNGRIHKKSAPIQIATVHEFKGKERDSIYIWNDSEGVFPSVKCNEDDIEQLEEERRVHYIACTRAKKREHIYTLQGCMGRFAKELSVEWESPIKPSGVLPSKEVGK